MTRTGRRSTDTTGFTPDILYKEAIATHLAKHPEDNGHSLVILYDNASIQVRREQVEDENKRGSSGIVFIDYNNGELSMDSDARDNGVA